MPAREIGVAVVGLGFMGRVHLRAYQAARQDGLPCRLLAVCSDAPEQLAGLATGGGNMGPAATELLFDPSDVRPCSHARMIAEDARIDLVSICTPTDTHVELAAMMLRAGKHVLVEKPVAVRSADVRELAGVAAASGKLCMPAMCMRFWPGWDWLKERVTEGKFGRVRAASFTRVGSRPDWSPGFYDDPARSGGALVDLHIHDADAALWLFGPPQEVVSSGSLDYAATLYRYTGARAPAPVVAVGGWVKQPGFAFRMRYTVEFEKATADWDMSRDPMLFLTRAGKSEPVPLPKLTAYDREVRAMVQAVAGSAARAPVTLDDAVAVADLLEAESESLRTGRAIPLKPR